MSLAIGCNDPSCAKCCAEERDALERAARAIVRDGGTPAALGIAEALLNEIDNRRRKFAPPVNL